MQSLVVVVAFATLMTAIVFCVTMVLVVAVTGGDSTLVQQLLVCSLLFTVAAGLWLAAAAVGTKRAPWRLPMAVAAASAAAGLLFLVTFIAWGDDLILQESEQYLKIGVTLLLLSGAVIHAGVFSILPGRGGALTALKVTTSGAAALLALIISMLIWFEDVVEEVADVAGIGFWSLFGLIMATSFLTLAGTVIVPIASLASSRRQHRSEWLRRDVKVDLNCPECAHRQSLPQGRSRCPNCRTTIIVELEEPRCACGYLLFELRGDTCPECGRPVDAVGARQAQPSAT